MKGFMLSVFLLCFTVSSYAQESDRIDNEYQFTEFLENSLKTAVSSEASKAFNQRAWAYWHEHKIDYNDHPEKYHKSIELYYKNKERFKTNHTRNIERYKMTIENFTKFDNRNTLANDPILFIGSSSIAGWETANSFPNLPIINRGIGGIDLTEISYYYDVLIKKHAPSILVLYCDIDIESGKTPKVAVTAFKTLVTKIKNNFPKTQIIILSMKPTLIDDFIGKNIRHNKNIANQELANYSKSDSKIHYIDISKPMIKTDGSLRSDIFINDGMHLNKLGYSLWTPIIRNKVNQLHR